jgi:hypothetical protein
MQAMHNAFQSLETRIAHEVTRLDLERQVRCLCMLVVICSGLLLHVQGCLGLAPCKAMIYVIRRILKNHGSII